VRSATCSDPEIRKNHIVEGLAYARGERVQLFRMLYWAAENEPELRKYLAEQWLIMDKNAVTFDVFQKRFMYLVRDKEPWAQDIRQKELKEIFGEEGARKKKLEEDEYCYAPTSTVTQFDQLTEQMIFEKDWKKRVQMYAHLPKTGGNLEDGDDDARAIFTLLWLMEPQKESREVLEQGIIQAYGSQVNQFLYLVNPRFLSEFSEEKKKVHISARVGHRIRSLAATEFG